MVNHNRLSNVIRTTLALYLLSGLGILAVLMGMSPEARPRMLIPDWSLPFLAVINGIYLLAMLATIAARLTRLDVGQRLTKAMNLLLLLAPPVGTILGIYGLWKVDKNLEAGISQSGALA